MFRPAINAALLCSFASGVAGQAVSVPSGLDVSLIEVILEEDPPTARFRFLVPAIGTSEDVAFSDVAADFQYLCDALVIPALAEFGAVTQDIVISMSAENLPFGTVTADVTQFFQPFSVQDDTCIWEDF